MNEIKTSIARSRMRLFPDRARREKNDIGGQGGIGCLIDLNDQCSQRANQREPCGELARPGNGFTTRAIPARRLRGSIAKTATLDLDYRARPEPHGLFRRTSPTGPAPGSAA